MRIVIPALPSAASAQRRTPRRAYISPATQSIIGTFTPTSAGTPVVVTANLSVQNNPNCQGTIAIAQTCTITFAIAPGSYTAEFVTYDQSLPSGSTTPPGNALSENQSFPITIDSGTTNMIPVSLDGIPAQVAATPDTTTGLSGNQLYGLGAPNCIGFEHESLDVIALDADGNYILGLGAPTPSLTSNNASLTVGTPAAHSPNVFPLGGPTSPAQFGAGGSTVILTASETTPPATITGGGISPAIVANASVNVTLAADCSVVTSPGDTNASASDPTSGATNVPGLGTGVGSGTGSSATGDLRYVMLNSTPGGVIVFSLGASCSASAPCTVQLQGPLPPILSSLTIEGGSGTVIDGGGAAPPGSPGSPGFRAFFAEAGHVRLRDLTIQNAVAAGGNGGAGGSCGGGGGLGAGAGLFVNAAASVVVLDVVFENVSARGGNGGPKLSISSSPHEGGGGGLGGSDSETALLGDGGGGVLGPSEMHSGGYGGGGSGEAYSTPAPGGVGYAGEPAGGTHLFDSGNVGAGGFGGGGGGGQDNAGPGGFGGGGGCSTSSIGGAGGFGGGGGGQFTAGLATPPPVAAGGFDGGAAAEDGVGGGGAALGPAIFVNAGSLITLGSFVSGTVSAVAGSAGDPSGNAGSADATPVFNNGGVVNGFSPGSPAGVSGALPTAAP